MDQVTHPTNLRPTTRPWFLRDVDERLSRLSFQHRDRQQPPCSSPDHRRYYPDRPHAPAANARHCPAMPDDVPSCMAQNRRSTRYRIPAYDELSSRYHQIPSQRGTKFLCHSLRQRDSFPILWHTWLYPHSKCALPPAHHAHLATENETTARYLRGNPYADSVQFPPPALL